MKLEPLDRLLLLLVLCLLALLVWRSAARDTTLTLRIELPARPASVPVIAIPADHARQTL